VTAIALAATRGGHVWEARSRFDGGLLPVFLDGRCDGFDSRHSAGTIVSEPGALPDQWF
jgi:hypothetical protein